MQLKPSKFVPLSPPEPYNLENLENLKNLESMNNINMGSHQVVRLFYYFRSFFYHRLPAELWRITLVNFGESPFLSGEHSPAIGHYAHCYFCK